MLRIAIETMPETPVPEFFVPFAKAGEEEEAYQQLAELVGAGVRDPAERIYSITWRSDGETWTATVGETLHGTAIVTTGRGRDKREREVPKRTDDTVLAIFPGLPYKIMHDNKSRHWNVPIYAGEPSTVVRFG